MTKKDFQKIIVFCPIMTFGQIKTVQLCSTLSKQSLRLHYGFSCLPMQLTIQKNSLERHLNVSFQFITSKIEVSNHDNDASVETV